jgi:iron complex outermembrane recepter protein
MVNLSLFYIDWTDIQQVQAFGGISALDNAGDAESKGFELESAFFAGEGFRLGFNAAYTDATLTSSPPALDNTLGVQLPGIPEWSGSLTLDYSFTLADREANVGGGYRYAGERYSAVATDSNNLAYLLPSYDVLDLNASLDFERMTLRLFASNLTDERGYTGGATFVDGLNTPVRVDVNVLQPRTLGVSMDYRF